MTTEDPQQQQNKYAELRHVLDELTADLPAPKTYTVLVDCPEVSALPSVIRLNP